MRNGIPASGLSQSISGFQGQGLLNMGSKVQIYFLGGLSSSAQHHVRPHQTYNYAYKSPVMASDEIVWYGSTYHCVEDDSY